MSGQYSPMGSGDSQESLERQAARAGRMVGFGGSMFGMRRSYKPGGCLGLRTVVGLLVVCVLMVLLGAVPGRVPLLPPKKAPTIEAAVSDFVARGKVTIEQGQISYGGASVLFLGPGNNYQEASLLVNPTAGVEFLNGSFAMRGKKWCVAVKRTGTVVVTTNQGVQPNAAMCGALGAPVAASGS